MLDAFAPDVVRPFLRRLEAAAALVEVEDVSQLRHPSFDVLWADAGVTRRRHLLQESALIACMGPVARGTYAMELGAGKGSFSFHLAQAEPWEGGKCVLIDRMSFRSNARFDLRIRAVRGVAVERHTMDIAHVEAATFFPAPHEGDCLLYCKHLCGNATDLALRVACDVARARSKRLVFATCCHGTMEAAPLGGPEWLRDVAGLREDHDWRMLCSAATWATLSHMADPGCPATGRTRDNKRHLGVAAKQLIDFSRVLALRRLGWEDARLVLFTDQSVENRAILARYTSDD